MKRKIFGAALLVALAVAASWNFNQEKNETRMSELALTNVEALAWPEDPNDGSGMKKVDCTENGRVTGAKCESSPSHTDKCHYVNDQWGKCN